ncbi:immune-associated nucleotide-binding protein 7 [Elysia marginata]|uniref:Immune-associated nucleotide-binding protein 7 n=1 Tax=Elysia marginata TaxID=1093978 RepID=A0AAV4HNW3_9GAST|nr:immune-associated nucleotide-binding protein 7 [Elysia marginata]
MDSSTVDLILIGRTGQGKSKTGNTILDRPVFKVSRHTASETLEINWGSRDYKDKEIKVVDLPGVKDTRYSLEKSIALLKNTMKEAMMISRVGYSAFLYVLKYPLRCTEDDMRDLEILEDLLKKDFAGKHGILVITGGDTFDSDRDDDADADVDLDDDQFFEQWCEKQQGPFRKLMEKCGDRVVLFDNVTKDKNKKCKQLDKLLMLVKMLKGCNGRYKDEDFEEANTKPLSDDAYNLLLSKLQKPITFNQLPDLSSSCAQQIKVISQSRVSDVEKLENIKELIDMAFRTNFRCQRSKVAEADRENSNNNLQRTIEEIHVLAEDLAKHKGELALKRASVLGLGTAILAGAAVGTVALPLTVGVTVFAYMFSRDTKNLKVPDKKE